jgi:preprotein translocase subunit SecE
MTNPITKVQTFLLEVWAELKKSSWPTRTELVDSTLVVLVTVVLLGIFVSFADLVFVWVIRQLTGAA